MKEIQKRTFILGIAGALIGGVLLGYWAGYAQGTKKVFAPPFSFPQPNEIFVFSGRITELKENNIMVKARIPSDAGGIILLEPRDVVMTETTKIQEGKVKTAEELARELQAYQKTAAKKEPKTPQSPVAILRNLTLQDLKIGDEIIIEAEENIKEKIRFEAVKVIVLQ